MSPGRRQVAVQVDGDVTTDPSTFDIDHLVPLNEAWQSGAWKWNADTRKRFANDLRYRASLIGVSASSNRSKGAREPQDWMPERARYACMYVKQWVAVKWRWRLKVNGAERRFLKAELRACGWPRVAKPKRAAISTGSSGGGGGATPSPTPTPTSTPTPTPTVTGPRYVGYSVHPGAFCSEHWWYGYTSAGTLMQCKTSATDARFRWRAV